MKQLNALIVGDPFSKSGGGRRCFELVKRYRQYGIVPILVIPPFNSDPFRMKERLPSLVENGVKIVGAEMSLDYAQRKKLYERRSLLGYGELSLLTSRFSDDVANLLHGIKIDFVIGHHEVWDVVQMTHQIAKKLAVKSAIVLQLPPFYQNSQRAFELDMLDSLILSQLAKKHPFFSYRGFLSSSLSRNIGSILYAEMLKFTRETMRTAYYKLTISKNLGFIDKIFAVSRSIPFEMGYKWGKNVTVLKPSLGTDDFEQISSAEKEKGEYCIHYSRLIPSKGILEIPFIWKMFSKKFTGRLQLYVVGKFEDKRVEEAFNLLISNLGLKDQVKYLGYLEKNRLRRLVTNAKALIYPSHFDAFSLTIVESLSLGTPVIAYDIPGTKLNFSENKNVIIVPEYDVNAMADGISQLIENRAFSVRTRTSYANWEQVAEAETSSVKSALFLE